MYNAFSQSLMKKYGWAPGEGLGKTNQGITQPIKATLKFDSHGISYKEIDTNLESKWSTMFSSSASKLEITNDNIITCVKTNSQEETLNLSGVNSLYGSFIKSDTVIKDGVEINGKKKKKSNKRKLTPTEITDEPIFKRKKKNIYLIDNSENYRKIQEIGDNTSEKIKNIQNQYVKQTVYNEEVDNKITFEDLPTKEKRKKKKKLKSNSNQVNEAFDTEITNKKDKAVNNKIGNVEMINEKVNVKKTKKIKKIDNEIIESINNEIINYKDKKQEKKKIKSAIVEIEDKKIKDKKKSRDLSKKQSLVVQESTSLTCHLSARSGITMSGKLARIQKLHEQELLRSLSMKSVN